MIKYKIMNNSVSLGDPRLEGGGGAGAEQPSQHVQPPLWLPIPLLQQSHLLLPQAVPLCGHLHEPGDQPGQLQPHPHLLPEARGPAPRVQVLVRLIG